jgi:hypothetical protein
MFALTWAYSAHGRIHRFGTQAAQSKVLWYHLFVVTVQTCEIFTRVTVANYAQKPRRSPEGLNAYVGALNLEQKIIIVNYYALSAS